MQPDGDEINIEHMGGTGTGTFTYRIINPSALTEHTYEIHIVEPENEEDIYGFDLVDLDQARVLLSDQPLPEKIFSHEFPITDGFKLFGANFEVRKPVTFITAEQTVDANPSDFGLKLLGDARTGDVFKIVYPNPLTKNDVYRFVPIFREFEPQGADFSKTQKMILVR